MMVLLSKKEYDDLVQKATAGELIAERKLEELKSKLISDLHEACKRNEVHTCQDLASTLMELLQHY